MAAKSKKLSFRFPLDVGVHSRKPLFEGQEPLQDCKVLDGECFYAPSLKLAQELMAEYDAQKDPEAIWKGLEQHYHALF